MSSGIMQNPFVDVGYRVVAMALCVYSGRQLWNGLVERKIRSFHANTGILDWLLDWSARQVFHRDTAPVRYWMEIGQMIIGSAASLFVVIFGWWQPNT